MKRNVLTQYLIITASCALYAVGFNWMFDPNHISVGGFTGLGQIINYLLPGLPIGTIVIILNVPLFVLGWRFIGKDFLFSSIYATAVSSLMIDGLAAVHTFKPMEPILACLYGGVIIGVSCGIMLREGATTGGTELAARLLKLKLESLSIGTLCLAIDILVTVTYALIFRDLTRALYARTVIRSKNMLQIIDNALNTVRMDPDHGELMYQVLYLTYFSKKKPANREVILAELDRQGFPMSMVTYHSYLNMAIRAIDRILWGYTARDCMEIIKQFLP